MRTTAFIAAAAMAGLAAASPAPQQLDFAQISQAPSVAAGPTGVALNQTASIITSVSVSSAASASVTGASASAAATQSSSKRDVEKRTFGAITAIASQWNCFMFRIGCEGTDDETNKDTQSGGKSSEECTTSSTSVAGAHQTSSSSGHSQASSSSSVAAHASTSSSSAPAAVITTSSTIQTSSGTTTSSSSTECPTQIEEGTYCGFINPEDPCAPQPGGK